MIYLLTWVDAEGDPGVEEWYTLEDALQQKEIQLKRDPNCEARIWMPLPENVDEY